MCYNISTKTEEEETMREKLIRSQQICTFEEWYEEMKWCFIFGFADGTPEEQYEEYVAREMEKFKGLI